MDSFRHYLCGLQGAYVQLERAGPDACQGWLVFVQDDYLTLRAPEGGDLHLPLHHIRSVSRFPPPDPYPLQAGDNRPPQTFAELLSLNQGRHVRLYHAGPEVTVGILRESGADHLVLEVATDEIVGFARFHVRSLYVPSSASALFPAESPESSQGR
ncbi:MAG TPA: hypothetical protein VGK74_03080 [Symbiobacteriaceae bacterium]|jgi:hypothetical protein